MYLLLIISVSGWFAEPPNPTTLVYPPFGHCMGIYRAGAEQLAILLGGLVRFDDPQGLECVKLDAWDDPGEGDDDELAVYGVNSGSGHVIYNADMYTLGMYGDKGSGDGRLNSPHGIAADPSGLVLVADTGNERVVILERDGTRLFQKGILSADFLEPWDVDLDGAGRIYVTDRSADLIYVFRSVTDSMPGTIPVESPTGIDAVGGERWFHDGDDEFIVVVTGGDSLAVIRDGEVGAGISAPDFGGGTLNYPVVDFWGNVWVTDSVSCCIHKFTDELEYLTSFGSMGSGDFEFMYPTGIALWKRFGQIFVAEREGARYFWVGADIEDFSVEAGPRELKVSGILTENALMDAFIYDSDGNLVFRLSEGRRNAGPFELSWAAVTNRGIPVPGGRYTLEVTIQPLYSSKGYFRKTFSDEFVLEYVDIHTRG